jgi:tRNA-splicing ligase RtcB
MADCSPGSSAPSSATRTSPRWSSRASTPTPVATSSWARCSRSSAPRRCMRCTNHHNFAQREEHFGRTYCLIRKGCTPARPGQEGFVGGSMGDESVILEGVESAENEQALFSTVHGAGRVMSRSQAAGRIRRRKRWACRNRDCERVFDIDGISSHHGAPKKGVCPDHPEAGVKKVWIEEQLKPGLVDWPVVQGRPARAGHRPDRRRRGRGAGGIQAPPRRSRRPRRDDPREAQAAPARRRDGRSRRLRPVQGLRGRASGPQSFSVDRLELRKW